MPTLLYGVLIFWQSVVAKSSGSTLLRHFFYGQSTISVSKNKYFLESLLIQVVGDGKWGVQKVARLDGGLESGLIALYI